VNADTGSDRRWRAFETEAMPHVDRLFRDAMWLVRNRTEAEDLVQETLVQALQSFHRFTPGTNCRAWLLSILQHVRSNRQRKQGRTIIDATLDEGMANVVPFVPPIPDHVTDEDSFVLLRNTVEWMDGTTTLELVDGGAPGAHRRISTQMEVSWA
jgi:DNA-directed RNA polymerase specialized sigma24 family protein